MSEQIHIKSGRYWGVLILIMIFLGLMGYHIINQEIKRDRVQLMDQLEQEFSLLTKLSTNLLQSGDYESVQTVFDDWIVNYPDVLEINLTSSNGFSIARVSKTKSSIDRQTVETNIKYGYRGNARLLLIKDTSWVYANLSQNIIFSLVTWLLLSIFGAYLIKNLLRHKVENIKLEHLSDK